MRVLLINSVCGSGSTGRIVSDLWSTLKAAGHDVKVAYGVGTASRVDACDLIRINDKKGYYVHNALSKLTDRTGFYSGLQTHRLVREIEKFAPDVIHLHNLHGYYINLRMLFRYLAKNGIPVVWTLHDCWAFTGHCAHFAFHGCDRWMTGCHDCPQKRAYPKSYLLDQSKRNYRQKKELFTAVENMTIVTPSKWLVGLVKQSFLGKYPVKVIYNGIDLDVFKPVESDFREKHNADGKCIVLAISNVWNQKKGFDDVCRLAKMLDQEKYQVVMVGLTKEQLSLIPEEVIAITRTENVQELVGIYSAADVLINPTYEDNFPTINIEAFACGTRVVTYNTGGSGEACDNTCGRIVPQGDLDGLKRAIDEATHLNRQDAEKRARFYDRRDRSYEHMKLYEEIVNNK